MAIRKEIWLILVLVLAILAIVSFMPFFTANVEQADAKKFVEEDLRAKFPDAETGIVSIVEKKDDKGQKYFEVKARIIKYADSACPERRHTYYSYPRQNFVTPPDEVIAYGCSACTDSSKQCVIAFPEEAVVASHTFIGTEAVAQLIREDAAASHTVKETPNSWIVDWNSSAVGYYYEVEISRSGAVLSVKRIDKKL